MAKSSKQIAPTFTSTAGLTAAELAALSIVTKEAKHWRDHVPVGADQAVDVLVRIDGTITLGDEQTAEVKKKPDCEQLLAEILSMVGPKTGEKIAQRLQAGLSADVPLEHQATAKLILDALTTRVEQAKSGNLTGKLTVTRLPGPPAGPGKSLASRPKS